MNAPEEEAGDDQAPSIGVRRPAPVTRPAHAEGLHDPSKKTFFQDPDKQKITGRMCSRKRASGISIRSVTGNATVKVLPSCSRPHHHPSGKSGVSTIDISADIRTGKLPYLSGSNGKHVQLIVGKTITGGPGRAEAASPGETGPVFH